MIGLALLLAMIVIPFTDLWILVQLAGMIGFWQTLAIVAVTGVVGASIVRREGRHVLRKLQRSVTAGEISRNVAEGALLVISGLLLITPGIITDVIGFMLAFRPLRERLVARYIKGNTGNIEIEFYSF